MKSLAEQGIIEGRIIPLNQVLGGLPKLCVERDLQQKIQRGGQILVRDIKGAPFPRINRGIPVRVVSPDEDLIAIARLETEYREPMDDEAVAFRLLRVFHENVGGKDEI